MMLFNLGYVQSVLTFSIELFQLSEYWLIDMLVGMHLTTCSIVSRVEIGASKHMQHEIMQNVSRVEIGVSKQGPRASNFWWPSKCSRP